MKQNIHFLYVLSRKNNIIIARYYYVPYIEKIMKEKKTRKVVQNYVTENRAKNHVVKTKTEVLTATSPTLPFG